jgi:Protein of unknown function (DUF2997)
MAEQRIRVVISPEGEVSIEAIGFQGDACEKATRQLEEALGTVETRRHKPEYHQRQSQTRTHNQ